MTLKRFDKTVLFLTILLASFCFASIVKADLNTDYVELKVTFTKSNGSTCETGSDCTSGNCVDGYCCDTTCTGDCQSCALSGTEGTCTTRSSGDNTECDPCNYCDGTNTTCQLVSDGTDPYGDCTVSCTDSCTLQGEYCDGAGSCDSSYCSAGTSCSGSSCAKTNYCNTTWADSSCLGDGCYNDGGTAYTCQAQCDGGGTCDYSANCTGTGQVEDWIGFDGYFEVKNVEIDLVPPFVCGDDFEYESQTYSTVEIGTQCWMAESLNVGTRMDHPGTQGTSCTSVDKFCYSNSTTNCDTFGALYQWDQVMCVSLYEGVQGICPDGWHIPTDAEWHTLDSYLAESTCDSGRTTYGCEPAGSKLSGSSSTWNTGTTLVNHADFGTSGFNAKGGGYALSSSFYDINASCNFWTSSENGSTYAWTRDIYEDWTGTRRGYNSDKAYSFYLRCIRGWECGLPIYYGGQHYKTVSIGDQCWMGENLNVTDGNEDGSCTFTRYCYNDTSSNCDTYGGLYTWSDMMCGSSSCNGTGSSQPECSTPVQGLCPDGWHIPSHYEWVQLERQICSDIGNTNCDTEFPYDETTSGQRGQQTSTAEGEGSALAGSCSLWGSDDLTNYGSCDGDFGTSGWDALPGAYHNSGGYAGLGRYAFFRSSTEYASDTSRSWDHDVQQYYTSVEAYYNPKTNRFSVRCVMDQ